MQRAFFQQQGCAFFVSWKDHPWKNNPWKDNSWKRFPWKRFPWKDHPWKDHPYTLYLPSSLYRNTLYPVPRKPFPFYPKCFTGYSHTPKRVSLYPEKTWPPEKGVQDFPWEDYPFTPFRKRSTILSEKIRKRQKDVRIPLVIGKCPLPYSVPLTVYFTVSGTPRRFSHFIVKPIKRRTKRKGFDQRKKKESLWPKKEKGKALTTRLPFYNEIKGYEKDFPRKDSLISL